MQLDPILVQKAEILKQTNHFNNGYRNPSWSEKQSIFLVLAGKKPVSEAGTAHYVVEGASATATPDDHAAVAALLDQLGLVYSIKDVFGSTNVVVSLDRALVEQYLAASDGHTVGLLFGYPETAVSAFGTDDAMGGEEQEKILGEVGLADASSFRFSKSHYREELAVVRDWYETLRDYGLLQK